MLILNHLPNSSVILVTVTGQLYPRKSCKLNLNFPRDGILIQFWVESQNISIGELYCSIVEHSVHRQYHISELMLIKYGHLVFYNYYYRLPTHFIFAMQGNLRKIGNAFLFYSLINFNF